MVTSLKHIVDALEVVNEQITAWLNPTTGEVREITEADYGILRRADDGDDLLDWERESESQLRDVLESEQWLQLPDREEIDDFSIMQRFCDAQPLGTARDSLSSSLRGRAPFRAFRETVHEIGLKQSWFDYRREALSALAREWMKARGLELE